MVRTNGRRILVGGFWATCLMTVFLQIAMAHEKLNMDFPSMLASGLFSQSVLPGSGLWFIGLILHFFIGTILLSFFYGRIFYYGTLGPMALRGLFYGIFLWFILMVILMPMLGKGFFAMNTDQPSLLNFWMLLSHAVYGLTLGVVAGRQPQLPRLTRHLWHG